MVTVRVTKPFRHKGQVITPGTMLSVPDHALHKLHDHAEVVTLQTIVREALAEVDTMGRPWPARFLVDMPEDDRRRLRELGRAIDAAVINGDAEALPGLLERWRKMLLARVH